MEVSTVFFNCLTTSLAVLLTAVMRVLIMQARADASLTDAERAAAAATAVDEQHVGFGAAARKEHLNERQELARQQQAAQQEQRAMVERLQVCKRLNGKLGVDR